MPTRMANAIYLASFPGAPLLVERKDSLLFTRMLLVTLIGSLRTLALALEDWIHQYRTVPVHENFVDFDLKCDAARGGGGGVNPRASSIKRRTITVQDFYHQQGWTMEHYCTYVIHLNMIPVPSSTNDLFWGGGGGPPPPPEHLLYRDSGSDQRSSYAAQICGKNYEILICLYPELI